jgi:hypothetical protein
MAGRLAGATSEHARPCELACPNLRIDIDRLAAST